jgi:predicted MFS family arabinose efflux permease
MSMTRTPGADWRTPALVIVAGCLIAMIGFGPRSVLGLFLEPMTQARGWSRETFGLAMAIQNLFWGLGVPVAGALADRFGPTRVLAIGALMYALGLWGMAVTESGMVLHLAGGVLTGLGVAFTAFSLALASMARVVGPEKRSLVLGLGTASGSMGQVVFSPLGQAGIVAFGWQPALLLLAASTLLILPLALAMPSSTAAKGELPSNQSLGEALREALSHRGYVLLTTGFFVCGFHVAFITVHFPAYVRDLGLGAQVGAYAIALIGLCNIAGSFMSGAAGQRWSKKGGLALIYFARAICITALLLAPKTELTIYLFAGAMGLLWLSTVPLTTGIVAQVFGVRYMATLFGVVFFSHQLGSFLGVWLGGRLYDTMGSYDPVWWAGVALGLLAAIIHLPINERPLARLAPMASKAV